LTLHKFYNYNYNFNSTVCGDINVDYLTESSKKTQLDRILQSYNLNSIVNFPTIISFHSCSIIDNFFIDNSYSNKFDIIPLINGLSDHNAQLLTLRFTQQHIKDHSTSYKRNINHFTIADFLHKLSHETWASVFEINDVNIIFNSFDVEYIYGFVWWGVCRQSWWRHSVTVPHTRWRICVTMAMLWQQQDGGYMLLWKRYGNNKMAAILHLQQYSHRLNLLIFLIHF